MMTISPNPQTSTKVIPVPLPPLSINNPVSVTIPPPIAMQLTLPPPPIPPITHLPLTGPSTPYPAIPLSVPQSMQPQSSLSTPPPPPSLQTCLLPPLPVHIPTALTPSTNFITPHQTQPLTSEQLALKQHNPTTVILANVPHFLRHSRNLRDFIYPCGSCRGVFFSCETRHSSPYSYFLGFEDRSDKKQTEKDDGNEIAIAIVKMSHSNGAYSLCRNWEIAAYQLNRFCGEVVTSISSNEHNATIEDNIGFMELKNAKKCKNKDDEKSKQRSDDRTKVHLVKMKAYLLASNSEHIPLELSISSGKEDAVLAGAVWESLWGQSKLEDVVNESTVVKLTEAYTAIRLRSESMLCEPLSSNGMLIGGNESLGVFRTFDGIDVSSGMKEAVNSGNMSAPPTMVPPFKLDMSKVAAAAGGGAYDEEADPLNAPEVLKAVAKFKKRLEERDADVKKKRVEFVNERLNEEVKKAKLRILKERSDKEDKMKKMYQINMKQKQNEEVLSIPCDKDKVDKTNTGVNQNEAPSLPPPLPLSFNKKSLDVVQDSGKRGVSNLPSWMTKGVTKDTNLHSVDDQVVLSLEEKENDRKEKAYYKRKYLLQKDSLDCCSRKKCLDTGEIPLARIRAANEAADAAVGIYVKEANRNNSSLTRDNNFCTKDIDRKVLPKSTNYPPLSPTIFSCIRSYVTDQIVEYLGEAETTLIDFVMNHLGTKGVDDNKSIKTLLDELSTVLEEDAEIFVVDLYWKMIEEASRI